MIKLDIKDKKILALLIHFARFNLSTIAKNVQLSRENVDYRLKRMVREEVIKGFTINLYLHKLMHTHIYDIFLKIEKVEVKKKDEIIKKLIEHPYILKIEECEGKWNLYIGTISDNMPKIKSVLQHIHSLCDYHLSDVIVFPIALKVFTERLFFLENINAPQVEGKSSDVVLYKNMLNARNKIIRSHFEDKKPCEPLKLDDLDKKLINLLKENSRTHLIDLAKQLDLSSNAVNYRIKRMVNEGLIAYFNPAIDFQKLGYIRATLFLNLKENHPKKDVLLNTLKRDKRTEYFNHYIGKWSYVFTFLIKDNIKFQEILYGLCEEYSDIILDYHVLWSTKTHKWTAIPGNLNSFH